MAVNDVSQASLLSYLQGGGRGSSIESLYQQSSTGDGAASAESVEDLKEMLAYYKEQSTTQNNKKDVNYSSIKSNAQSARNAAGKLMESGSASLYAKAEASGDNSEILKEIKNFVTAYNDMMSGLKNASDAKSEAQYEQFQNQAQVYADALEKAGITVNSDGTLKLDETKLKEAKTDTLKSTFCGGSSFLSKVKVRAIYVESNANINERMEATGIYGKGGSYDRYLSGNNYSNYNKKN